MMSRELKQGERILSLLQEKYPGYHPVMGIAKIAHSTDDEQLEFNCHKAQARYVEPELKSVEVSQAPRDSEILKVIFEGEFEEVIPPSNGAPVLEYKERLPVEEILDLPLELKIDVAQETVMVATVFIVRKAVSDKETLIDGITTVIINSDDTDTEAAVLTAAEAALVTAGHPIPTGYFNTADQWDAAGQIDTDDDMLIFGPGREEVIA